MKMSREGGEESKVGQEIFQAFANFGAGLNLLGVPPSGGPAPRKRGTPNFKFGHCPNLRSSCEKHPCFLAFLIYCEF
jgi:hypothetical protein